MLFYILVAQEHFTKRKKIMTTLLTPQEDATTSAPLTTNTDDIPVIAQGFSDLNLSENLLKALADMNFTNPSSIQKEAIPQVLSGSDIIAKAPTGSGKTAAFAIPIIEKMDLNPENKSVQSLILCPTRELAIQVHKEFEKLTKYFENVSVVSVYGGQDIGRQLNALKREPQIVVATPGRLMDHLRRGSIKLDLLHTVVLDEADEMLDMGFRDDIHTILEGTPENRQTILFSATMAKNIIEITKKFQKSPNMVDVTDNLLNTPDIEQQYFEVVERDKVELLTRLLNLHNVNLALVFCNTKSNVDRVVEILKTKGYFSDAIHGDMNQGQREKVMRGFRNGSVKVLVATDVAGRGIDVKNIEAVFNYDLPRDDEDYIHRVGRTGRAGTSGISFTFVSKGQVQSLKRIERANGIQIHKKDVPTFEEIQVARVASFKNKIKSIIDEAELSEYKSNIDEMVSEGVDVNDIAAALLKFYMSKEGKKINQNVVFETSQDEGSERGGRRRERNRGDRSRGDNRDRGSRSGFSSARRDRESSVSSDFSVPRRDRENSGGSDFSVPRRSRENGSGTNFSSPRRSNENGARAEFPSNKKSWENRGGKDFQANRSRVKKSGESVSIEKMVMSFSETDKNSRRKPFDKSKTKFSGNFNKKSKSKSYR